MLRLLGSATVLCGFATPIVEAAPAGPQIAAPDRLHSSDNLPLVPRGPAGADPVERYTTGLAPFATINPSGLRLAASDPNDDLEMLLFEDGTGDSGGETLEEEANDPMGMEELFAEETATTDGTTAGLPLEGFFQSELAYTYESPSHWSKFRNLLEIGSQGRLEQVSWKASVRLSYDGVFEIEDDFYPSDVKDDRQTEAMIRETYLDFGMADWEFRVGRQHIIWGEMVGLFFADVVSAKDLRQFVAQDFELIRIPQWAIRGEYFHDDLHLEAIWIPYVTTDDIGEPGDDFYPFSVVKPGPGVEFRSDEAPDRDLSDTNYGLRLSYLLNGWDLAGFYYRSTDASPTFFRSITPGPAPKVVFEPEHKRIHQFGGTLAKDLGPNMVLKAEAIYTLDRYFSVETLSDSDGVVQQDFFDYVVGLDYTTDGGVRTNFQFFQRWYTDHDKEIVPDEVESGASVYIAGDLPGTDLEPEFLLIHSLNRTDWMARPRVVWGFAPNWRAALGADLFGGPELGLFGQFDRSDRVYGELRYSF
jgi:hypothetical protein